MKTHPLFSASTAILIACSALLTEGHAQTVYYKNVGFFGSLGGATNKTSTGWTSTGLDYTTTGLSLEWVTYNTTEYHRITNLADVTGTGPSLDRYISTVVDPSVLYGASSWQTTYRSGLSGIILDVNEGFEIRSSLDNFNAPLVRFVGAPWINTTPVTSADPSSLPDGTFIDGLFLRYAQSTYPFTPYVTNPDLIRATDEPIELRYYYWSPNPDGSGFYYDFIRDGVGSTRGTNGWSLSTATVVIPEPSSAMLSGLAAGLLLMRRRRTA